MMAFILKNGDLVVSHRVTDDASGVVGDMLVKINDQSPDYKNWLRFVVPASPDIEEKFANVKPYFDPPKK